MKTVRAILITALLASAASATYYLDERFEGTQFPPDGWRIFHTANNAGWSHGGGWPPGANAYAAGIASGPPERAPDLAAAALVSPPFIVPAPTTLYYRFVYRTDMTTRTGPHDLSYYGEFYLYYVDTGERLVDLIFDDLVFPWEEASGSGPVSANRPLAAVWYVVHGIPVPGSYMFDVDTCQICDENLTAVGPASLGRVKALFR